MKNGKFIVEHGVKGAVNGCNTIEDLQGYLDSNPHQEHRLVSAQYSNGIFIMIWEKRERKMKYEDKQPYHSTHTGLPKGGFRLH
jgi:hypothetical protein